MYLRTFTQTVLENEFEVLVLEYFYLMLLFTSSFQGREMCHLTLSD